MRNNLTPFIVFLLFMFNTLSLMYAQEADSIEVYLIDSYVKQELPHTFYLSYFTSDLCKSTVIIDDNYEYTVSDEFTDMHNFEIEITDLEFNSKIVKFIIYYEDEAGNKYIGETFDFDLPYEPEIKDEDDSN